MMEYKGYLGKVDIDGEELGTVVNLDRDHVEFHGRTIDEGRRAFHDSVDSTSTAAAKTVKNRRRPFSGRFVVSPDTHRRASTLARVEEESLNAMAVEALEEYLSHQGV